MVDRTAVTAVVIDSSAATRGAAEFDRAADRIKQANQGAVAGAGRVTKALADVARATERAAKAQAASAAAAERARKVSEATGATAERIARAQAAAAAAAVRAQKATDGLAAANDRAARAQAGTLREGERLNAIVGDQTRKVDALRRQLDPAAAATQMLADKTALLDRALSNGRISAEEHASLLGMLRDRYGDAGDAADDAARKASQSARRLGQLSPQISDIVTQAGMGTSPFQILIQQGPQIADIFGGIPELIKRIPGPVKVAAGALGVFAAAAAIVGTRMATIAGQARRLETITGSLNPTLGATAAQLRAMTNAISEQGASNAEAAAVTQQLVAMRGLRFEMLQTIGVASVDVGRTLGVEPQQAATDLAEAFKKGAAGIAELDQKLGFLSPSQLANIELLDKQGKRAEALAVAMAALNARFGGDAKQMQSAWGGALMEMGNAWDRLLEKLANNGPLLGILEATAKELDFIGGLFSSGADGAAAGADETAAAIARLKTELAAAKVEAERLAAAAANGVGMVGDPAGEAVQRVIDLQDKIDALVSRQAATVPAPAPAPTAAPGGQSDDETKRIERANRLYAEETGAMRANAIQRQVNVAVLEAERAALERGAGPAEVANERRLAELRVRRDLGAAIADENAALDMNARKTLEVAAAYGVSTEAGLRAEAARQAAIEAQQSGVDAAARARDLLRQAGADAYLGGAQDLDRMRGDIGGLGRIAAGVGRGPAAGLEAQRTAEAEAAYRERIAAASAAGDQKIVEGLIAQRTEYETLLRQRDEYNRKIAMAGTAQQMQDELEMIELEGELVGATNERREREVELLRLRQQLIAAGYTGAELDAEYDRLGKVIEQRARLTEATRRSTEEFERNRQAAYDGLNIMRDGFEDLVLNGEKFTDVLKNMSKAFLQLGMDLLVMAPLREAITGMMQGGGGMTPGSYTPGKGTGAWGTVASLVQTGLNMYGGWSAGTGASQLPNAATDAGALSAGALLENWKTYPVAHSGWHVGNEPAPAMRAAPSSVFVQAPRFHSGGMAPGERGVIVQDGEEILTARDPRHRRNFRGGGGTSVVMNITTPDANSFRSSQGQLSASAGRAIAIASRRNG